MRKLIKTQIVAHTEKFLKEADKLKKIKDFVESCIKNTKIRKGRNLNSNSISFWAASIETTESGFNYILSSSLSEYDINKNVTGEAKNIINSMSELLSSYSYFNPSKEFKIVYEKSPVSLLARAVGSSFLYLKFIISFTEKSLLLQQIKNNVGDVKKERLESLLFEAISYFVKNNWNGFPPIYDSDFKITPISNPGTYKTAENDFIYLPRITNSNFENFKKQLSDGSSKNSIIYLDEKSQNIFYFNSRNIFGSYSYTGYVSISDKDIISFLDSPYTFLFESHSSGLGRHYAWGTFYTSLTDKYLSIFKKEEIAGSLNKAIKKELDTDVYINTIPTVGDIVFSYPEEAKNLAKELSDLCEQRYNDKQIQPLTYLKFKGDIEFFKLCTNNPYAIKKQILQKKLEFESITSDSLPPLPNFNQEISLFPHQAEAIAKLGISDTAIIDSSVGSGKTIILIGDIINLLNQGKIKRPLVVVPGTLVPQWISQIKFVSDNKLNAIPITTEIVSNWGQEHLEQVVQNAPINTIFVTTYSFLCTSKYVVDPITQDISYGGMEWVKSIVNCDFLVCDESHKIKHLTTDANKALTILGSTLKYKRIATGTLINNKPEDLIGQTKFLDPSIIGNTSDFKAKYYYGKGILKKDFAKQCRNDIKNSINYLVYRKKDYAPLLPKVKYEKFFVDMSDVQRKIYRDMVTNIIYEIKNDEALRNAWEKLTDDDNDDLNIPPQILAKFAKLEQYLTAPELYKLTQQIGGQEYISPKVKKMDELIQDSIKKDGKVIVAVHYKESARHLMKYSKYSEQGVYYDASNKNSLYRFINDDSCKVLYAVVNSLKEGLNLQVANRIIIADIDWTPGNAEQLEARINRPYLRWKDGKAENLNKNKTVYISLVLANDSADVAKYIFQNYKRVRNTRTMEDCPIAELVKPDFSELGLVARIGDPLVGGQKNLDLIKSFEEWQENEIDAVRQQGNLKFKKPKIIKDIDNSKKMFDIPWVSGMDLPINTSLGEIPLAEYAEQFDEFCISRLINDIKDKVIGKVVRTEFGYGTIVNTTKSGKVKIKQFNSKKSSFTYSIYATIIAPDITEKTAKQLQAKENVKQEHGYIINVKQKNDLINKELSKLNDSIVIDGYGEIKFPDGKVTVQKVNEVLKPFEITLIVKYSEKPLYKLKDIRTKKRSSILNIKKPSDKTFSEWVQLALDFRNKLDNVKQLEDKLESKVEIPSGKATFNKLSEFLLSYDFKIKRRQVKVGFEYKLYDITTNTTSKTLDVKRTSELSFDEWLNMCMELRKLGMSKQTRLSDISIKIPSGKATFIKVCELFRPYNVTLGRKVLGRKNYSYYLVDKFSKRRSTLSIKKPSEYTFEDWIKILLNFKNNVESDLVKSGMLTPQLQKEVPSTDEPLEPLKMVKESDSISVTSKDNTESDTELDTESNDNEFDFDDSAKLDDTNSEPYLNDFDQDVSDTDIEEEEEEEEEESDNAIEVYSGVYNGILAISVPTSDIDSEKLLNLGFKDVPEIWMYKVKSKNKGYKILEALQKKFKISDRCVTEINTILNNIVNKKYVQTFPANEVRNWLKLTRKPAPKGTLRLYPYVVDKDVYLVADVKTHKGVNLSNYLFTKQDKFHIYFAINKNDFKNTIHKIKNILTITNWDNLVLNCKRLKVSI